MRLLLTLFAVLAIAVLASGANGTAGPEYLSYEEFLEKVQADEVKSLTMGPWDYLKGTRVEAEVEIEFFSKRPMESASDPLLTELLAKHEVKVVREPPAEPNSIEQYIQFVPFVLLLLVPSVLLVIVLVYLVRLAKKIDQVLDRK